MSREILQGKEEGGGDKKRREIRKKGGGGTPATSPTGRRAEAQIPPVYADFLRVHIYPV